MDSDNAMASVLKRKRAPVEVLDTSKRAKSSEIQAGDVFQKPSGWDAAFKPPPKINSNGEGKHLLSNGQLGPPEAEAIEFDEFVRGRSRDFEAGATNAVSEITGKKKKEKRDKKHKSTAGEKKSWRISGPIAGRMIDADPVFTVDEKYARCTIDLEVLLN